MAVKQMDDEKALALAYDAEALERYLRTRLVQLAGDDGAVAVRAIEMLRQWPVPGANRNLSHIPTKTLKELQNRALQFITGAGSVPDDHDGTRAP